MKTIYNMTLLSENLYRDKSIFRNEIKFKVFNTSTYDITQNLKRYNITFLKEYPDRWINNIYFDNKNLDSLYQSIEGSYMRCKTRLRWYGNYLEFSVPKLELKIKKGYMNTKKSFNCLYVHEKFDRPFSINNIKDIALYPKSILRDMKPIVSNRYFRKYLISNDKKIRITIDSNLCFSSLKNKSLNQISWKKENLLSIIELKFQDHKHAPRNLMTFLNKHYQLSQISKYTYGVQLI